MNNCCERPSVANFDHKKFDDKNMVTYPVINRVCIRCHRHWYGVEGQVKSYTKSEWEAWINSVHKSE